jgi:hypothetical protein
MKDWSYFRWGCWLFLSFCTALAFIFALVGSHAVENRKMASTDLRVCMHTYMESNGIREIVTEMLCTWNMCLLVFVFKHVLLQLDLHIRTHTL